MMTRTVSSILITLLMISNAWAQRSATPRVNPTFEQVISLSGVGSPVLSPDGRHILFSRSSTEWENNRFDREIWIAKEGGEPFQLTNTAEGSSRNPQWSPDGRWISFLANRDDHTQLYIMRAAGGEAHALTNLDRNISDYRWSPDGGAIAFTMSETKSPSMESREQRYGDFVVEEQEYRRDWLYKIAFQPAMVYHNPLPCYESDTTGTGQDAQCRAYPEPEALIDSVSYTVTGFRWSPDGTRIAFTHQPDPLINSFFHRDISIYDLESGEVDPLVRNPSFDGLVDWSPDGRSILYSSSVADTTSNYYKNSRYFTIRLENGRLNELATGFDENLSSLNWTNRGIYGVGWQKTERELFRIDPESGEVSPVLSNPARIHTISFSGDSERLAFLGSSNESLNEIFTYSLDGEGPQQVTRSTEQISDWKVAQSEVISWTSKDGTTIEGVLHKPMDYDPDKQYPLMVVIHGGPTGISVPQPTPAYVYPIVQWLNKGALVLRPNYRGSAGYGEEFRKLNVRNLGVGDAWDVLSGVDHLAEKGIIDTTRLGAMGWSQGGYISAFLTTTTDRFEAISVGAGISNWITYYVNTDIHPFTRQYLKATPWSDEAIYEKTSPMTYINQASTPTLIQHGEFDRRVPIPNARELFQGLRDLGVDTRLIVYEGFGHGISKPKEQLAAMWHNWQWFGTYIWNEEIEIPLAK